MTSIDQQFDLMLPQAMLNEMLERGTELSQNLLESLENLHVRKGEFRERLTTDGWLCRDNDLPIISAPTTCGVDGASIVERLMSVDLIAAAAVAIEGLIPPSETRYWEDAKHRTFVHNEPHNPDSGIVVAGMMWQMELDLAANAPHDIVFIDGSLTNPIIKMNAAIEKADGDFAGSAIGRAVVDNFKTFLEDYHRILCSTRSDKFWIGMPKYTSKRELGERMNWPPTYDDRSLLTSLLKSGEYTNPVPYKQPKEEKSRSDWHLAFPKSLRNDSTCTQLWTEILAAVHRLHVVYYKPHSYTPVLRIEVPASVKSNKSQMRLVLDAIKFQTPTASIMEPYPLYMADCMVKEVSKAVPAVRQIATRTMAEDYSGDLSEVFFSMHSYRTDNSK